MNYNISRIANYLKNYVVIRKKTFVRMLINIKVIRFSLDEERCFFVFGRTKNDTDSFVVPVLNGKLRQR